MAEPHILVILADGAVPESLLAALRQTSATASFSPLSEAARDGGTPLADAVVVVVPDDIAGVAPALRVLFDRLAEHPRATLILKTSGDAVTPMNHPRSLPVTFFSGVNEQDLAGRLSTMLAMRDSLDSLHCGMLANRRSGENIARRYANQLRLASQVQREFLPEDLPRFGSVSFSLVFRPVDFVSGDIYDVHQLDEEHVGIAIADATGHGIPAALLTVYVKRALRGKEIENGSYRILSPDEVLLRLNDDLLDASLSECPFVAAVYAVLNTRTYELGLARGGAPYPLYRTADGELHVIESSGGVVGVLPGSRFEVRTIQMQPGDSLLFHSDGLERIVAPESTGGEMPDELMHAASRIANSNEVTNEGEETDETGTFSTDFDDYADEVAGGGTPGIAVLGQTATCLARPASVAATSRLARPSIFSAPSPVAESQWGSLFRRHGPAVALEQVSGRQRALRRMGYPLDDLTVLCLHIDA